MPTAHCVSTSSGIIKSVDAGFCALLQRRESDLIGKSYQSITVAADISKSADMLQSLVGRAEPIRLRKRYHRPDGSFVEADLLVSNLKSTDELVTTLAWEDRKAPVASPHGMWKAALRVRHLHLLSMQELGRELFCDFVGAILVQVYLSEAEGEIVTIEEVAGSISLRLDTASRWVKVLCERKLLESVGTSGSNVQLTNLGLEKVERLLEVILSPYDLHE